MDSNTPGSVVYRCPGEGICDRFTGVGKPDWSWEEKIEEACTGCSRCKGNGPLPPGYADESTGGLSQAEIDHGIATVSDICAEIRCGITPNKNDLPIWIWSSVKFWIMTERDFDRRIQLKISSIIDAFTKK